MVSECRNPELLAGPLLRETVGIWRERGGAARSICTHFIQANRSVADTPGTAGEASSRKSGEAFRTVHEEGSAGARVPGAGVCSALCVGAAAEQTADFSGKRSRRSEDAIAATRPTLQAKRGVRCRAGIGRRWNPGKEWFRRAGDRAGAGALPDSLAGATGEWG